MQRVLRIGEVLDLLGELWEIEGIANNLFLLRNTLTGVIETLSLAAVSRRLDTPPVFDRRLAEVEEFSFDTEEKRRRFKYWVRRTQEVIFGKADGESSFRLGYDPALTKQSVRIDLMVKQQNDAGVPIGRRTLERYIADYKKYGPAGLLDGRTTQTEDPWSLPEDVQAAVRAIISECIPRSNITHETMAELVRARVIDEHPDREGDMPTPARIIVAIKQLSKGKYLTGDSKNRQTAANSPKRKYSSMPAVLPGSEVQIDSSRFDVRVRMPTGKPGSVCLTIMLDKATRSILATSVQERETGANIAYLIAQALTPAEARPIDETIANPWELKRMNLPWADLMNEEEQKKWDTHRPVMRIFRLITDNGKDYRSNVVESACHQLGIILTRAATRTPTDKAIVERAFLTIRQSFVDKLPGQTGGSPNRRGEKVDEEDLISVEHLAVLFDRWVAQIWQNLPMDGLRDPEYPLAPAVSPNVMFASMFPFIGYVPVPLSDDDYISLLPIAHRTIQNDGIEFQRRQYDSAELQDFRLMASGDSRLADKWEIHHRPWDPRQIWVYVPHEDRYITCDWQERRMDNPHLRGYWRISHELQENGYVLPTQKTAEASASFIRKEMERMRREEKRAQLNETAERLATIQNLGGPATRTRLAIGTPEVDDGEEDWDEIAATPMEAFDVTKPRYQEPGDS